MSDNSISENMDYFEFTHNEKCVKFIQSVIYNSREVFSFYESYKRLPYSNNELVLFLRYGKNTSICLTK